MDVCQSLEILKNKMVDIEGVLKMKDYVDGILFKFYYCIALPLKNRKRR